MPHNNEIDIVEDEIKALGAQLCELIAQPVQPPSLSVIQSRFAAGHYSEAIRSLEWNLETQTLVFPEAATEVLANIITKVEQAKRLYETALQSGGGFKNPFDHMNTLMKTDENVPHEFGKRYGISEGAVKSLWLTSPAFEERFIRRRIGEAIARSGARTGHYIFAKRRYKLTEAEAKRLVDDMWDNPSTVSKVFHDLLDREKLVQCRITDAGKDDVAQVQARYGRGQK